MTKPIGYFCSGTNEPGLLQDMEESWGSTFDVLSGYQRAWILAQITTVIFEHYQPEDSPIDEEVEEATERLEELTFNQLLDLLLAVTEQARERDSKRFGS